MLLDKCSSNDDTRLIVGIVKMVSWSKLWDLALNGGRKWVSAMRAFIRIISYPSCSNSACPICDANSLDSSLLTHILNTHMDAACGFSDILDSLQAPASISHSDSNTGQVLSNTLMDTSSNFDPITDFPHFFNRIYPLSTLFTCWS